MFGVSEKISLTASLFACFLAFVGALIARVPFEKVLFRTLIAGLFFGLFTYALARMVLRYFFQGESEETKEEEQMEVATHVEELAQETPSYETETASRSTQNLDKPSLAQQIVDDFSSEQLSAAVRRALKEEK